MADPIEAMDAKLSKWKNYWDDPDANTATLNAAMTQLREKAFNDDMKLSNFGAEEVGGVIVIMKKRGLGVDRWSPQEWKSLPSQAIGELTCILKIIEARVAMPEQVLLNTITLIPKPAGGDRPICLASLIYVLWAMLRSIDFRTWDEGRIRHWDTAIKGSSSLRAALSRRLCDECVVEKGGFVANIDWDLEKF